MNDAARRLAGAVAEAHGVARLRAARTVDVAFSSGGLAFATKAQPRALADAWARLSTTGQTVAVSGELPRPWNISVVDTDDLRERLGALRSGRRRAAWSPEDLGVFAAGALWTYLMVPLLLEQAPHAELLPEMSGLRRLRVELPAWVAGHGAAQTLHIDAGHLVRRHDYTAVAFGRWARASQAISGYRLYDGVPVGTVRRVTPRAFGPLPAPTLVWIEIESIRLTP